MKFLKIESYQKGIAISSFFNIIAKIILFVNSIIIAYYFGTQSSTDIYFFTMSSVIGLLITLVSGLNLAVIIPESMRIREQENEKNSMNLLNFYLYLYVAIGLLIIIPFLFNPVGIFDFISKFGIEVLTKNKSMLLLFIPLFILIMLANYLTDILTSYKYFTLPTIAAIFNNSSSLVFILIFHNILEVKSILLGLNISYLLNIVFLVYLMQRNLKWNFSFKFIKLTDKIKKNILYAQAGNLASVLGSFAPIYILSSFGSGVITSLSYGQKTANIPNDFITSQFTAISGIRYNELYAQKNFSRLNMVFSETAKFLIFIMVPISVLSFIFSDEIITLLFQRGKFDINSAKNSALFMKYLVLILPFVAVNGLAARLYMAAQLINYSFWYQIFSNLLLILMVWIGIKNYGSIGFPYALIAQNILNIIAIYFFLKFLLPFINYGKILLYFILIILLNIALGFFVELFVLQFSNPFIKIATGTTIYISIYILLNIFFKINYQSNFYLGVLLGKFFPDKFRINKSENNF
jgi:peptidoglycan biosynthesis protein MviN/MurJ (putative lipid II flippase)